ncbi:CRISPR-associated protein Cas5 [Brachyspira innocens]|uniref:CRISPR-associated protein Cas5 n=1 Tax=Brachyspira innocens TaxID=13264 RepID=UPI0026F2939F|nr:CRISPR-associated protein Cas5 [Brachyspira innocens]
MKVIKIKCYQNMVNYKRLGFNEIWQSFPLPPYSSIIGMIHKACGFTEYKEMFISVQGESANSHYGLFTKYSFAKGETKFNKDSFKGIGNAELLIDVQLIIHVYTKDEELFNFIYDKLNKPDDYLALGRHEDILRIDSVDIVDVKKAKKIDLEYSAYIPIKYLKYKVNTSYHGTTYIINKQFFIEEKNGIKIRKWDKENGKINVKYMRPSETRIEVDDNIFGIFVEDDDNELGVFLA